MSLVAGPPSVADGRDLEPRPDPVERPRERGPYLIAGLIVALVVAAVAGAAFGAFAISPGEIVGAILRRVGLSSAPAPDQLADDVFWQIRMPRVVLGIVVGASLGCAGAAMQGAFANPLAEPGIVGVSSGAVLGAVTQIVLGFAPLGQWTLPAAAFSGGLVTLLVVYASARSEGRTEVITLVLSGVALNALLGAVIGLLTYVSDDEELRSITFWTLGSLAQATWPKVAAVTPLAIIGLAIGFISAAKLDLLALGDRPARHLGLAVERFRFMILVVVAVLTASAVAVSGIVLFVGLVIPHLVRMIAGPSHRYLLPASALGGALVVVLADLAARTIAAPQELPLGVLTSLVGSPFFFWQLRRTRATQGGWA